jgi:hypothetical protein
MTPRREAHAEFRAMGFSTRTINALFGRNIYTVASLNQLTERDAVLIRGIGPKAMSELRAYLRKDRKEASISELPVHYFCKL